MLSWWAQQRQVLCTYESGTGLPARCSGMGTLQSVQHQGGLAKPAAQLQTLPISDQITPASSRSFCTSSLTLATITPPLRLEGSSTCGVCVCCVCRGGEGRLHQRTLLQSLLDI